MVVSPNPCYAIQQYGVVMAEGGGDGGERALPGSRPSQAEACATGHSLTTQCVEVDFFRQVIGLAGRQGAMVVHDFG